MEQYNVRAKKWELDVSNKLSTWLSTVRPWHAAVKESRFLWIV